MHKTTVLVSGEPHLLTTMVRDMRANGIPLLAHPRNRVGFGSRRLASMNPIDSREIYLLVRVSDLDLFILSSTLAACEVPDSLLPRRCPFDGFEGHWGECQHSSAKSPAYYAGCSFEDCIAAQIAFDFITPESAIAAWNQRAG